MTFSPTPMHDINGHRMPIYRYQFSTVLMNNDSDVISFHRGKSGPALGSTEYRLMPSAFWLIVRAYRGKSGP